jgi:WD40 repeat protein
MAVRSTTPVQDSITAILRPFEALHPAKRDTVNSRRCNLRTGSSANEATLEGSYNPEVHACSGEIYDPRGCAEFPAFLPWRKRAAVALLVAFWAFCAPARISCEAAAGAAPAEIWQSEARLAGHLALTSSPDAAFSPDGSLLAVVEKQRVALLDLAHGSVRKVLRLGVKGVTDLQIQSASFISPGTLLLLANGTVRQKHAKGHAQLLNTPELAFRWNIPQNSMAGKVDAIRTTGGYSSVRYFSTIGRVAFYKDGAFVLWDPVTGQEGSVTIPQLAHTPGLFTFAPDGQWLLMAQVEMNALPNPMVVRLQTRQFANVLQGHQGPVLGMMFSRNGQEVATASADREVRVFSVPGWKLIATLGGNNGPVHWAEFSPDGNLVASAGEDKTVRVWSLSPGKPPQTLVESRQPLLTVAFSPSGRYLAATSANHVYVWSLRAAR